jgi:hypothetical protein
MTTPPTTPESLGHYVASLKASSKYDAPTIAGLPMVGLGGSCGKPAFLLPTVVRFDLAKVARLEAVAKQFGMFVEYGAYPHLKEPGDKEIAAVQDWTNATLVFLRPGYGRKEELLAAIAQALRDSA